MVQIVSFKRKLYSINFQKSVKKNDKLEFYGETRKKNTNYKRRKKATDLMRALL